MAADLTVAQLERMLERKKSRMNALLKRRDRLQKALASVDAKLSSVGGVKREIGGKPRKVRKRPKNEKPLYEVVLAVLGSNKKGLTLADLSKKVLDTGYKTNSSKFDNTVYQCLYNNQNKIMHDPETRLYRLK
jgi:hypothetical protein